MGHKQSLEPAKLMQIQLVFSKIHFFLSTICSSAATAKGAYSRLAKTLARLSIRLTLFCAALALINQRDFSSDTLRYCLVFVFCVTFLPLFCKKRPQVSLAQNINAQCTC